MRGTAGLAAWLLMACAPGPLSERRPWDFLKGEGARLRPRPRPPAVDGAPVGLQPLGLEAERDGFLFIPSGYRPDRPVPLVVMLHGAGSSGMQGLGPFLDRADDEGIALLGPDSRGPTWDVLRGGYGPDVAFLDRALDDVFGRYAVDGGRVAVEGFSDGASYALGLGLANGDLFGKVIAFSPGFAPPGKPHGRPELFVSHGVADDVLPIDQCSRRIVPALEGRGYEVRYREFEGGHDIPPEIRDEALAWLFGRS